MPGLRRGDAGAGGTERAADPPSGVGGGSREGVVPEGREAPHPPPPTGATLPTRGREKHCPAPHTPSPPSSWPGSTRPPNPHLQLLHAWLGPRVKPGYDAAAGQRLAPNAASYRRRRHPSPSPASYRRRPVSSLWPPPPPRWSGEASGWTPASAGVTRGPGGTEGPANPPFWEGGGSRARVVPPLLSRRDAICG